MIQEWNIQSRAEICARTGRPFVDGEIFYTLLHGEPEGLRREDISREAWEDLQKDKDALAGITFWRSKFEPPTPVAPPRTQPFSGRPAAPAHATRTGAVERDDDRIRPVAPRREPVRHLPR